MDEERARVRKSVIVHCVIRKECLVGGGEVGEWEGPRGRGSEGRVREREREGRGGSSRIFEPGKIRRASKDVARLLLPGNSSSDVYSIDFAKASRTLMHAVGRGGGGGGGVEGRRGAASGRGVGERRRVAVVRVARGTFESLEVNRMLINI
jgi:hypothetical protein